MIKVVIDIGASYSKLIMVTDTEHMETRLIKTTGFQKTAVQLLHEAKQMYPFNRAIATGGGASHLPSTVEGIRISRVNELQATGAGGLAMSGLKEAIVVSMGTGTAVLQATETKTTHLGGTGIGGGTLIGLSQLLVGETHPEQLEKLAMKGDHTQIDLIVRDLYPEGISNLLPWFTASNFGKIVGTHSKADLSAAIHELVAQTIGIVISLIATKTKIEDIVLVGASTKNSYLIHLITVITQMRGLKVTIPKNAEFATAYGAMLIQENGKDMPLTLE
jgi:type II pantothenate kinase